MLKMSRTARVAKMANMSNAQISLICVTDAKYGISKDGKIPWRIREDIAFFHDVTRQTNARDRLNAVVMGKNTWKALPSNARGLRDRINIIVSNTMTTHELESDNSLETEVHLVHSLNEAVELSNKLNVENLFICGGKNIYIEALRDLKLDNIYFNMISHDYGCDNLLTELHDFLCETYIKYETRMDKSFKLLDELYGSDGEFVNVSFLKLSIDKNHRVPYNKRIIHKVREEQQYLDLLEDILRNGDFRKTRNGYTWSVFGKQMSFDLSNGFPMLTTKRMFLRGIFEELLFFLKGDTNAKHLSEKGIKIWDANTTREFLDSNDLEHYEEGDMGPVYGFQWLHFGAKYTGMNDDYTNKGVNQLEYCLNTLKTDRYNRRNLMTTLNVSQVSEGVLWPCHSIIIQWYVEKGNRLSMSCYNRSQDFLLGNPFNMTMSALLIHMLCEVINNDPLYTGPKFKPGRLIMNLGDVHLYKDHYSEAVRQILREPYDFPQIEFKRKVTDLTDFKYEDIEINNYKCYPNFKVNMVA